MLHTSLFVLHCLAFLLTFSTGVFLIVYSNFTFSSVAVMEAMRNDNFLEPASKDLQNRDNSSEAAVRDLRNCMVVVGAISLAISLVVLFNLYCFLTLMLSPNSRVVRGLPGMENIREQLEVEVASMDVQRDL